MAKIVIEWLSDSDDCDTCGFSYASGARVFIDGELKVEKIPVAYCQGGDDFSEEDIYKAIIIALGNEIIEDQ